MKRLLLSTVAIGLASATGAYAQISTINSAVTAHVFNEIPGATVSLVPNYPTSITLGETNVSKSPSGGLNRDVWQFSANGTTAYQVQGSDYFQASFNLTLTGSSISGVDLEAGWLFSNPGGTFGGDLQSLVIANGQVVQFGGPSYYPFSPAAGGYPKFPGAPNVPNYVLGQTYTLGLNYVVDPNTGKNAFQYSVNGVLAESAAGNTYFDLNPGQFIGSAGDVLGGYFQIGNDVEDPSNNGTAVFSNINITEIPEPSALALVGLGVLSLVFRRRS